MYIRHKSKRRPKVFRRISPNRDSKNHNEELLGQPFSEVLLIFIEGLGLAM